MNEGSDGGRRWALALGGALAVVVCARFVRIEADPPWGIVSRSGEFLTDEGWYTKAAQLRVRLGAWTTEHDTVWFTHNSLYSVLQAAAFELFGVGVTVARLVSVGAFVATLAAFHALAKPVLGRNGSLAACLAVAVTLPTFAYSRMALVEPTGVAVSMLALAAWARLPRGIVASGAGLVLAAAAYFVKISFLFTLVALVVLALADAVLLARERRRLLAAATAAAAIAAPLLTSSLQDAVSALEPEQAETFGRWHVQSRLDEFSARSVVLNEAKMGWKLLAVTGCAVLVAALLVGAFALWRRRREVRWTELPRPAAAIGLWALGGISFFGLFEYQPPRYLYFTVFPLAYLAVWTVRSLVPDRRAAAAGVLVALHAAAQAPGYVQWLSRDDLTSADRCAREAIAAMDLDGPPGGVAVLGGTSAFLSLYDGRIRPLDFREDWLAERVRKWRPRYLFAIPVSARQLVERCPEDVERIDRIAAFRVMSNFYTDDDHVLYRIVYTR